MLYFLPATGLEVQVWWLARQWRDGKCVASCGDGWIWDRRTRLWILAAVLVVISGAVGFAPRVALGVNYHEFADQRTILGIPRGFDVLSNIPFVLVGMWVRLTSTIEKNTES